MIIGNDQLTFLEISGLVPIAKELVIVVPYHRSEEYFINSCVYIKCFDSIFTLESIFSAFCVFFFFSFSLLFIWSKLYSLLFESNLQAKRNFRMSKTFKMALLLSSGQQNNKNELLLKIKTFPAGIPYHTIKQL